MSNIKIVIGVLLVVAGIFTGFYIGLWWAFIGGIVSAIEEIKSEDMEAIALALDILRIVCASVLGWLAALFLMIPGRGIVISGVKDKRRRS